jgi:ribose-phosphate pyrophosphokinase
MQPRVIALSGSEDIAASIARRLDTVVDAIELRTLPDGESYVRIDGDVAGRDVVIVCTLDRPNEKVMPLYLLSATARDLGARRVGLAAPYLAYMRQDTRFAPGEGVTSSYFANLVSSAVDWLVTVDPHLHRRSSLQEIYRIPASALHAAPLIATWLRAHVPDAVVIGPDVESRQWVQAIGQMAAVPTIVLEKVRRGPFEVEVSIPSQGVPLGRTPVLLDDILSTGSTMLAALAKLRRAASPAPVCVAVHAVCAADAPARLVAAGAASVVTCNTIRHPSNAIDVGTLIADGVSAMLDA